MSNQLLDHPLVTHQNWDHFTQSEHKTWNLLFLRQLKLLQNRACIEIMEGMEKLDMCNEQIPKFSDLDRSLEKETGFSLVPVKGFIPEDLFFRFLSERKFPSTCFIRKPHELDYLEEPDIFHDVFGHVPLLVNPTFADLMEKFGKKAIEAIEHKMLKFISTLYWFTVEFGLIKNDVGIRAYGSGITSSIGELVYSLESEKPIRVKFNPKRIMRTKYHIDSFQRTYFVIDNFQQLFDTLDHLDWNKVRDSLLDFPEIEQGVLLNAEEKVTEKN